MTASASPRYPAGTGLVAGYVLGVVVGLVAWRLSEQVTLGLLLFVATGTALGVAFEQSGSARPLTPRERRVALFVAVTGVLAGVLVLVYVVLVPEGRPCGWPSGAARLPTSRVTPVRSDGGIRGAGRGDVRNH